MKLLQFFITLICLIVLTGCGQNKNSAKLKITQGFAVSNGYFAGGLIVHGESATGQTFTIALDASLEKTITLNNGSWTFYAMGWDGGVSNLKFEGDRKCGMTTQTVNDATVVDISISQIGCSGTSFITAIQPLSVSPATCGAFYTYNFAADTYAPITAGTALDYCNNSLPVNYWNNLTHYRVVAMESLSNNSSAKYSSTCKALSNQSHILPTAKIPLMIKAYKSLADCNSAHAISTSFNFPKGILAGNDGQFEHQMFGSKLFLPSSNTRRGTSPFMNMLPRILCGPDGTSVDCIPSINAAGTHVLAPWYENQNRLNVLLARTSVATCPVNLLNTSKYFYATDCLIEDRQLKAKIHRNQLTCQASPSDLSDIVDIYTTNNRIYILTNSGSYLQIFDLKGRHILKVNVGSANAVAALADDSKIYISSSSTVREFSSSMSPLGAAMPIQADDIDITTDQKFLVTVKTTTDTDTTTYPILPSFGSTPANTAYAFAGGTTEKLIVSGGSAYILDSANGKVYRQTIDGTGLLLNQSPVVNSGVMGIARAVTPGEFYTKESGTITHRSALGTQINIVSSITSGNYFAVANTPSYFYVANPSELKVYDQTGTVYSQNIGDCSENVNVVAGVDNKTLSIRAKFENNYDTIDAGLRYVGLRTIPVGQLDLISYLYSEHVHEDDELEFGGGLDSIHNDLGPSGISGILGKDFPTCLDLKTHVAGGAVVNKIGSIYLPWKLELVQYSISTLKYEDTIPAFVDAATGNYDVRIKFSITGPQWYERGSIKLACGKKLGEYERFEQEDWTTRRLTLWNTESNSDARYESYHLREKTSNNYETNIIKLEKVNTTDFSLRDIRYKEYQGNVSTNVTEYQYNDTAQELRLKNQHLGDSSSNFFFNNSTETARFNFTGDPTDACQDDIYSVFGSQYPGCTIAGTLPSQTSKGLDMNLDIFNDPTQTPIRAIFDPSL